MARSKRRRTDRWSDEDVEIPPVFESWRSQTYQGIVLVFGAAVAASGNKLSEIWLPPSDPLEMELYIVRILLFLLFVAWAVRFVYATDKELMLWKKALGDIGSPTLGRMAMLATAIYLGLLMAFPHRIVFVSGLFTASLCINYWTQRMCNKVFARELVAGKKRYAAVTWRLQILEVMECYWVRRPQLARLVGMMLLSALAFGLALVGAEHAEPQKSHLYVIAYIILIGDLIVCETVISYWRYDRNKTIDNILESRGRLKR